MSKLLSILRLLAVSVLINFASITILVILRFNEWDVAATIVSLTFSVVIILIELLKTSPSNATRPLLRPLLALCIVIGGASGFFWFFHLIHKLGHYQGDIEDTLWTSATILLTFIVSMHLVVTSYKTSKYVLVETADHVDHVEGEKHASITLWAQQYFKKKQAKKDAVEENLNPV
ncbi:hypothetical protein PPYR_13664 [Photinus pyralis]|uniref:Uncharacterized protein n=1 Tax=Photinus pyralis TaxID=7054 RepID=A0A1Y1N4M6_PHOPY|nr:uncharacterized protein LOC116178235 [Photinus pyralis]KAB0794044.1 hypothetical protein PPYR_13664 [Photinus pyralis]